MRNWQSIVQKFLTVLNRDNNRYKILVVYTEREQGWKRIFGCRLAGPMLKVPIAIQTLYCSADFDDQVIVGIVILNAVPLYILLNFPLRMDDWSIGVRITT